MLKNKRGLFVYFAVWFICAFVVLSATPEVVDNEFVVEQKSSKEKKYSELQEELILAYEELLREQTEVLHTLADAQEQCLDALKKTVINTPKMARARIEKEIERVKKLAGACKDARFF